MSRASGVGLMMVALVFVGCGDTDTASRTAVEEREPYEELATAADTSDAFATEEPIGVVTVQGGARTGGPLTATGDLRGREEGSNPGTVALTESDGGTELRVSLERYEAGSELQVALVSGACGATGQAAEVVEPTIEVSAEGVGTLETTVDRPLPSLLDGNHSIRLVNPEDAGPTMPAEATQACADLPALDG